MDQILEHYALAQDVALDIDAELCRWRRSYRSMPFHRNGIAFEAYIPAFKFGYDSYLGHFREDLRLLMPSLRVRYERKFPAPREIPWSICQGIVEAVWERIRDEHAMRVAASRAAHAGEPAHASLHR